MWHGSKTYRAGFNPIDSIEERSGGSVASSFGVDAFNIGVSGRSKEVHKHRLDGLGLVDDRFGSDLDASNRARVDVVLLQQALDGCSTL